MLFPTYVIFMVSLAACGASHSLPLFIVFRAVMGFAGIGFVLLGPAVVADLMPVEKRGLSLSIMSAGPVVVSFQSLLIYGCLIFKIVYVDIHLRDRHLADHRVASSSKLAG